MDDIEIRDWLNRYLRKDISLREFQRWFVPATWNIDETSNAEAKHLAAYIDLRLAELVNHHWTEQEFREQLDRVLENQTYEFRRNYFIPRQRFSSTARPFRFAF